MSDSMGKDIRKIKVIIVTFNSAADITMCINSLFVSTEDYKLEISVVDNASSDETVSLVERFPKKVEIIQNKENLGYAAGNNIALKQMLSCLEDYVAVLIINPDIVVVHGTIERLISLLYSSQQVVAVSPNLSINTNSQTVNRFRSLWGVPMRKKYLDYSNVLQVDRLLGAFLFLKPYVFREVGLFDESFFLYGEEIELCMRIKRAGYKMLMDFGTNLRHRYERDERPLRIYYIWRNVFYFSFKSFGRVKGTLFLLRRIISLIVEISRFSLSHRFDLVRVAIVGVVDGMKGNKGKSRRPFLEHN